MDNIVIKPIENGWVVQCTPKGKYIPREYYCIDILEINRRVEEFLFRFVEEDEEGPSLGNHSL